ncbi:MAG: CinA family protein [Humidesulfovibrio sp.]|nr:CinA family protein [Humidesulfovibrio sp.]
MKNTAHHDLLEQEGALRLERLASDAARLVTKNGWLLATAESCTGGLLASTLTNLSGSSTWFHGGVVAYSNALKSGLLGVDPALIETHGAVSEAVVLAMAQGALALPGMPEGKGCSVAISGIAGPTGGTREKPVGTVWIGWAWPGGGRAEAFLFRGARAAVKAQSVAGALFGMVTFVR